MSNEGIYLMDRQCIDDIMCCIREMHHEMSELRGAIADLQRDNNLLIKRVMQLEGAVYDDDGRWLPRVNAMTLIYLN